MNHRAEIIEQTNLAFDFILKLYLEVSYLIKEIEGMLYELEEKFVIGRSGGYHISARSSTGLESSNVSFWLMRKLGVFFIPENKTDRKKKKRIGVRSQHLTAPVNSHFFPIQFPST